MVETISRGFDDEKIPDFWKFVRDLGDNYTLNVRNAYASKTLTLHRLRKDAMMYKYVSTYGGMTGTHCEGLVVLNAKEKTLVDQQVTFHLRQTSKYKSESFRYMASLFFENSVMYPHLPTLKATSIRVLKLHVTPHNPKPTSKYVHY